MKVLLIRPPYTRLKGIGQSPYFPLGLGYIAAVLKNNGYEVMIYHVENPGAGDGKLHVDADITFDTRSISQKRYLDSIKDDGHAVWREVRGVLADYKPDVVGISILSVEVPSALKLSRICREYDDKCRVVWGGLHPSFMPEACLNNREVDFVIRGEGEFSMLALLKSFERGDGLSEVAGLSYRRNGEFVHNPQGDPVVLDELPYPERENLIFPESFDFKSLGSMIFSRGCPFRCSFCSSRNFWDKKVRLRSAENVVGEISFLRKAYGTKHIMFWDDTFTFNRNIIRKHCRAIIDADLKISWKTATRADLVDEDMLDLMKKSGCVKLEIGVESGSERMRKLINKDVTHEQIMDAMQLIDRKGLGVGTFFMAGFPEEKVEDLEQTFSLMKEINSSEIAFNVFDPMPGSSEYEKCVSMGLVPEDADWNEFPFWPDAHYMKYVGREEFTRYANEMARWVYEYNNSLGAKYRRSKQQLLFLLKNDPVYLGKKIIGLALRRMNIRVLKSGVANK
jgi:radical SAM superfamily enzyme YgiQ (UPF0313 family)